MAKKRILNINPLDDSWSGAHMRLKASDAEPEPLTPDPNEQGVIIATGAAEQALKGKKKPEPEVQP